MSAFLDLTSRPAVKVLQCLLAVLAPVGVTVIAVVVLLDAEPVAPWIGLGLLLVLCGVAAFDAAIARVRVDASGLHFRTLLRRWSVPWPDVAELRVHRYPANQFGGEGSGVSVRLRDGRRQSLPLPYSTYEAGDPYFHAELARLHALFRRHGNPAFDRLPVITHRTTGYGWATSAVLCLLLLGGAGVGRGRDVR